MDIRINLKRELLSFIVQKIHGGFTPEDVGLMRSALDPKCKRLPVFTSAGKGARGTLQYFRCAVWISGENHKLFVPFYEDECLLFALNGDGIHDSYSKSSDAMPFDPVIAEGLLDTGLRSIMNCIHPVSILLPKPSAGPVVTAEEAHAVLHRQTRT